MDLRALEDLLTGKTARLRELYRSAFSESETERFVRETKKQNRTIALLLLLVITGAVCSGIISAAEEDGNGLDLIRPGAGETPKRIEADVIAEYGGHTTGSRAEIRIMPRELSPDEAEASLSALKRRLPGLIAGGNDSLDAISHDLFLPDTDAETGAELFWSSSDPRIIANDGSVNLIGADSGTIVTLTAFIQIASVQESFHIAVRTGAGVPEGRVESAIDDRVDEIVKETSTTRTGEAVSLPEITADGIRLVWQSPARKNGPPVLFVCMLAAALYFSQRYRVAAGRIEKARAEMERDFPDFIQKLGLLLGAGLVITSAISRITEDYLKIRADGVPRRLYDEFAAATERTRAAGTPLVYEVAELARRSGLRELMRFSSMLADNIDKGSVLEGKLRTESELLWESRKKRAEREGRIAETKLIFPMALQIFAVIAITVMPAAFEMG